MKIASPMVPARYFAIVCDILDSMNVTIDAALHNASIDRKVLNLPDQMLTSHQSEVLLREAIKASGRSDLAFELGRKIRLNSHDLLGFALLSCDTMDHLLRLSSRYYRLITPMFSMHYQRDGNCAEIVFRPSLPMSQEILRYYLEAIAVGSYTQFKSSLQNIPSNYDVYVSMEAPPHLARYKELGMAKFHFAPSRLPEVRFRIADADLDAPLPMANPQALSLAEDRCKALLCRVSEHSNWTEWTSMMLHHAEDCQPTLMELAKLLNITARTLDRYLAKEGTSFRDLSIDIRNQRARQLLSDRKLAISQIAYRLGYTDIANFSRSFRKTNGISPTAYQETLSKAKHGA